MFCQNNPFGYPEFNFQNAFCPGSRAVIGFDMGGTSTDVSRYGGAYEHVFETTTAGVTIQAPQLDISTVAAGGKYLPTIHLFWGQSSFRLGSQWKTTNASLRQLLKPFLSLARDG